MKTTADSPPADTILLLGWLPLWIALQGVPHSGALRTLLLLVGLIHIAWRALPNGPLRMSLFQRAEQIIFWSLVGWLMVQSVLFATEPPAALIALGRDWGKLILLVFLGVGLARCFPQGRPLILAMFLGSFLHVLAILAMEFVSLTSGQGLVFQQSPLGEYPVASAFTAMALIWLLVDGIARRWGWQALFPWPAWVTALFATMSVGAEALLMAKSGQLLVALLLVTTFALWLLAPRPDRRRTTGLLLACLVGLGMIFYLGGMRWTGLADSLRSVWQEPYPLQALVTDDTPIPSGTNHSFYMRAVRGKVGVEGIGLYPLGLGYGPDIYRRYIEKRFGISDAINSSNSGLIDFALAEGVIGLALLLLLAALLFYRGWQAFLAGQAAGLALAFFSLHHLGRYFLDSTLGGSRFNGPVLVIVTLWALSNTCAAKRRD